MKVQITNSVLILRFKDVKSMNKLLDPISNEYEGILHNRIGHNFPSKFIPQNHKILSQYKSKCEYVIGVAHMSNIKHELLHAKFYSDSEYREKIENEWANILTDKQRILITQFLKKNGYSDKVIIDEYQAYRYSEPNNFFGFKL